MKTVKIQPDCNKNILVSNIMDLPSGVYKAISTKGYPRVLIKSGMSFKAYDIHGSFVCDLDRHCDYTVTEMLEAVDF